MNEDLIQGANESYNIAEEKAIIYYNLLEQSLIKKKDIVVLKKNIELWGKKHIKNKSLIMRIFNKRTKKEFMDYKTYIEYLDYTGKLDNYLDRSISYIFIRDLGKAIDSEDTRKEIEKTVENIKKNIKKSQKKEDISMAGLYKKAKEEGIEYRVIWLLEKLKTVSKNIPNGIDSTQAMRKIIKIIMGVVMHQIEQLDENVTKEERSKKLDESIVLGYSYGLTYPFIDDLFDSKILSTKEEKDYSDLIRETLLTGEVPEIENWDGENIKLIKYVHAELKDGFKYIKSYQSMEKMQSFLNLSYAFFNAQEKDRNKELENAKYTNKDIYIPVILKSAISRLIVKTVINAKKDTDFEDRIFFYGIYNQLADDFTDMFDDFKSGAVTPYTYYMKYHSVREDIINPFELYWVVISHLINNIYNKDDKTCEVIIDRAINGLKRLKERTSEKKYNEIMDLFIFDNEFNNVIQNMVCNAEDVDFFDKLLRDYVIDIFDEQKKQTQEFKDIIEEIKNKINKILKISDINIETGNKIVDAANYSIESGGKRLRPIISWFMGVKGYGLSEKSIEPLLKSLEYMHTASLILDDLPSQDNAQLRRGRKTLHEKYDIATAELSSLFLTQQAINEQASLNDFNTKNVLKLIKYSTEIVKNMCNGQCMDLNSKNKTLTLEELKSMCFYKTGIAFEASLVMVAILANVEEAEIKLLKQFAKYAGIAFQIKDDILDLKGDTQLLGKSVGQDSLNNSSTFVSILGYEKAEQELWEHYILAMDILKKIPRDVSFLMRLMDYIVNRDH